ncbi:cytochrome C oxidase subunit II [Tetzosporium hominis]|uniref:Cytochrome C oxidase subunit II n=2 Tax=Caryophanaceae TaxID=186818 RepID=A0A264W1E0_9BACL|nr:cytochrome C oxidase subunit II [Tetzosporium hominis]PJK16111.1 cytochrome C oxidase subunit II [Chryseomicrobium excrementi]
MNGLAKKQQVQEENLKGTLISVFFVGFVIVAMWVAVYLMYLAN